MWRQLLIVVSAVGATVGLASPVLGDDKSLNGTACTAQFPDVDDWSAHPQEFENDAASSQDAVCPIERDLPGTTPFQDIEIHVENGVSQTFSCTAYAITKFGAVDDSSNQSTTTSGTQTLDFGTAINVTSSRGSAAILCTVPTGADIFAYYWNEG